MSNGRGRYSSVTVARYIVALCNSRNLPVNMTKVQKLLYIAYGLYLAVSNGRLVDEHPQAWPYGPVFPTTRNRLLKVDFYTISADDGEFSSLKGDSEAQELFDLVLRTFGSWPATRLTKWSHKEGSPWETAVNSAGFRWGDRMNDNDIQAYFRSIVEYGQDENL